MGGNDFKSLINFGFSLVPILHSFISNLTSSILGFLGTSLESNKSSKGVNPLSKKLSSRLITLVSSFIISSISTFSRFSTSDLVNLVGLNLSSSSPFISLISNSSLMLGSMDVSVSML